MRDINQNKTKGARVMKTKCKVGSLKVTPDEAQDLRSKGYYVLMTGNLKKVISVSKDKNELISLQKMGLFSYELKYSKMFGPLKKVKSIDGAKAWATHNKIWDNSTFGGGLK